MIETLDQTFRQFLPVSNGQADRLFLNLNGFGCHKKNNLHGAPYQINADSPINLLQGFAETDDLGSGKMGGRENLPFLNLHISHFLASRL